MPASRPGTMVGGRHRAHCTMQLSTVVRCCPISCHCWAGLSGVVTKLSGCTLRFTHRLATMDDLESLEQVMDAAIAELQRDFLTPEQIESSRAIMGIDTQLVADGTYVIVFDGDRIAGCGGWSRR